MYPSNNVDYSYLPTPTSLPSKPPPRPHALDRNFRFPLHPPPPQPNFQRGQQGHGFSPSMSVKGSLEGAGLGGGERHERTNMLQLNPGAPAEWADMGYGPPVSAVGGLKYDRSPLGHGFAPSVQHHSNSLLIHSPNSPHALPHINTNILLTPGLTPPPINRAWTLDSSSRSNLSPLAQSHGGRNLTRSPLAYEDGRAGASSPARSMVSSARSANGDGPERGDRRVFTAPSYTYHTGPGGPRSERLAHPIPERAPKGLRGRIGGPPKAVLGGPGGKTFDEMMTDQGKGLQSPEKASGGLTPSPRPSNRDGSSQGGDEEEEELKWKGNRVVVRMPHKEYNPPESPLFVKDPEEEDGDHTPVEQLSRKEAFPWPAAQVRLSPESTPLPISPRDAEHEDPGEALSRVPSPDIDCDVETLWKGKKLVLAIPEPDAWGSLAQERDPRELEKMLDEMAAAEQAELDATPDEKEDDEVEDERIEEVLDDAEKTFDAHGSPEEGSAGGLHRASTSTTHHPPLSPSQCPLPPCPNPASPPMSANSQFSAKRSQGGLQMNSFARRQLGGFLKQAAGEGDKEARPILKRPTRRLKSVDIPPLAVKEMIVGEGSPEAGPSQETVKEVTQPSVEASIPSSELQESEPERKSSVDEEEGKPVKDEAIPLPPHLRDARNSVIQSIASYSTNKAKTDPPAIPELPAIQNTGERAAITSQNATLSASVPTAIVEEVSEGRPESDKPTKRQRAVDEGLQASERAPISIRFGTSSAPAPRPSLRPTAASFKPKESKGIVFGAALARDAEERSSKASRASTTSTSSSKKLRAAASESVPPSRSFASESANFTFAMPFATIPLWSQGGLIDTPCGTSIGDAPAFHRLNFVSSSAVPFKPASLRKVSITSIPSSSAPRRVDSPAESVATTTASEAKMRASAPIFTPGAKSSTNSSPAFAPSRVPSTTPLSTATKIRAAAAVFMPASSIESGSLPSSPVKGSSRTPSISSTTSKTVLKHDAPAFIPSSEKRKRARAEDYLHREPSEKTSSEMEVDTAPRENVSASTESGIQTVEAGDDGKVGSQVVMPVPAEDPAPANEGQTTDQVQGDSSSPISAPSSAFDTTTAAPSETAEVSLREMDGSHHDEEVKLVIEQADGDAETSRLLPVEQSVIHFRREASPMPSAGTGRPDSLGNSELSEVPSLSEDGRTPRPSLATRHSYNSYRPRDTPDISSSLSEPTVPLDDVVIHPSQPLPSHHTAQIHEKSPSITMLSVYASDEDDSTEPFATAIEAGTEDGEGVEREMESIATPDVPYTASTLNAHYSESEEEASGSVSGTVREAEFADGVEQSTLFGSQKVGETPGGSNFEFTFGELSRSSPSSLEQIEEQNHPQDSLQPTLLAPAANAGPPRSLRSSAPNPEVSSRPLLLAAPSPYVPMVALDSEEAADFKRFMEYSKMSESPRAAFPDNLPDVPATFEGPGEHFEYSDEDNGVETIQAVESRELEGGDNDSSQENQVHGVGNLSQSTVVPSGQVSLAPEEYEEYKRFTEASRSHGPTNSSPPYYHGIAKPSPDHPSQDLTHDLDSRSPIVPGREMPEEPSTVVALAPEEMEDFRKFTEWMFPLNRQSSGSNSYALAADLAYGSTVSSEHPHPSHPTHVPSYSQVISSATTTEPFGAASEHSHPRLTNSPAAFPPPTSLNTSTDFVIQAPPKGKGKDKLLSVEAIGRAIGVDSDLNTPATGSYSHEASGVMKMLEDLCQQYGRKDHISSSPGGIGEEILHSVHDLTAQQSEWSSYLIEKLTSALEDQTQLLTTLKQNMSAPPVSPSAYPSTQNEDAKGNTRQEEMFTAILTSQHAILSKFDEVAAIRLSSTDDLHTAIAALHEAEDAAKDRSSSAQANTKSEVRVATLSTELASTKSQVTSLEAEIGILKQRLKDTRYERNELRDTMDAKEKQLLGAIMSEEKKNEEMDRLVARALAAELERDAFAKKVKEMRLDELEDEKELKKLQLEMQTERTLAASALTDKDEALAALHSALKETQQALASTQSQLAIALQAPHPAPTLNPPEPSPLLVSTSSALAELSQSSYSFHEEIMGRISKLDDDMHESMGSRVKEYGEALGENRRLTGEVDTLREKLESASRERLNLEKDVLPKLSALETEHVHTVVSLQSETARREAAEFKLAEMEKRLSAMQEQTMRWQIEVATRHSQAQMGEIRLQTLTQENVYWREFALGADRRRFRSYVASRPFEAEQSPDQSAFHTPATGFKSAARSTARIVSSPLIAVTPTRGGDQRNTSPLKRSIKGSILDSPIVVSDESMDMDIVSDESRKDLLSPPQGDRPSGRVVVSS
ncbi:hypothetical protein I350_03981 [Cryptococcus amylolentus CBS 6273]|uniref:Uncharacterized protein n=1 Tax=Cryptococcus amylolentus CBS 6273 TaxID=1296118 RepID=A0A1E3K0I5_9TREE|nr:hypothetical protein I350_03981 [Cryptococcus amylolentus CBS 6273]